MKLKSILKSLMMFILPVVPIVGTYGQDSLISVSYHSGISNLAVTDVPIVRNTYGGTKIVPTFIGNWDPDQMEAFQTACSLWEEVLPTTFPIKIKVKEEFINSNMVVNSALSTVFTQTAQDSLSYYNGEPFAPCNPNVMLKGVLYKIMTGETDGDVGDVLENTSLFEESEIEVTYYHYANKALNDIYSFSINSSTVPSDKYDFITCAMRDIAKGLGLNSQIKAANGRLHYNSNKITPFEKYIVAQLPSDKQLAYGAATQGSLTIYGENHTGYQLYAPTTWSNTLSLKYFYPNNDIKVTKLLDWNFGTGQVVRDIVDSKTNQIFHNLLGWNGIYAVGIDDDYIYANEFGANTGNAVPYQGDIVFTDDEAEGMRLASRHSPLNRIQELSSNRDIGDIDVYQYHPNYLPDGSTNRDNRSLALLLRNGEWDVIYSDPYTIEGLGLEVSYNNLQIHYPDSSYARTYDGKLRGRYTYYKGINLHETNMTVNYFVLDALPQAVEVIPSRCTFMPEFDNEYDEYTGVIRVPIGKTAGTTRIVVAQYDEGDTFPFYYEVPNVKDSYFTAVVDREYDTRFVLTAYNENGYTQSSYTYTPDFVNEAPYRALFQTAISPDLAICPKKVIAR